MSKFRVKAELLSGKSKYIELEKKQNLTVKELEAVVAKAFSLNGVNLKYKLKNGTEQGLYQDFHLEAAITQSQEAGDRFFVLNVVPGAAINNNAPAVSQPASNPAPVASKPVDNKRQSVNVGGGSHTNAFSRLTDQIKDFENTNVVPSPVAVKEGFSLSSSGSLKPKFCANCGAPSASGKFCPECGTPYPLATTPSLAPVATPVSKVQETDNKRKRMSFHPGSASANITKTTCAACSNSLGIDSVNALEKQWHKECFVCQTCKKSLVTEGFKAHEGRPICVECFNGKFGLKCTGCQKAISAAYVQVKGNPWHSDCFVCGRCKKPFDAGYGERDGEYLCGSCINFY